VLQLPLVVITPDGPTTFCQESSVELVSNSSTGNLWSNNSTNSSIVATESGTYSLTITDSNGCSNTAQIIITNTGDPCIQINGVFTPNGDGTNDTWTIPGIEFYQNVNVEILNRWGQQLFLSNGYQTPWDGTYNGEKLPVGDYFYIINLENGIIYKGALTLKY
jgi:gliding motility-associated-like protein